MSEALQVIGASVIIPAFNAAATLDDQLAALARQDVSIEWELLLCDNGSRDRTAEVARSWQGRLPNLVVVDASARRGAGAARNIGAAHARGRTLIFCDADDIVNDDWLSAMHKALQSADFVAGGRRYTLLNTAVHGPADWTEPLFTKDFLPQLPAGSGANLGVRADLFAEVGGFDESMRAAEDIDLCWRIQLAGHPLIAQPDAVVQMRRRPGVLATFRQSYSYGVGDRFLLHKYANVIASPPRTRVSDEAVTPVDVEGGRASLVHRSLRKVLKLRFPFDVIFAADRFGRRLGLRFGRVERSAPRLTLGQANASGATDV